MSSNVEKHYALEKRLAEVLKNSSRSERLELYGTVYDMLYTELPDHDRWNDKSEREVEKDIDKQFAYVQSFLDDGTRFLELGAGSCAHAFHVAQYVDKVDIVEISDEIIRHKDAPENVELHITNGIDVPLSDIDLAFSHQLMEHLHPDDAKEQLKNVYDALKKDGVYICVTPNCFSGPHDVSKHFSLDPEGFHLKEYTTQEVVRLFEECGFSDVRVMIGAKGIIFSRNFPKSMVFLLERILKHLPKNLSRQLGRFAPLRLLLGIRVIGVK